MRNWDYRYCWLRDAAMTARALVDLGSLAEAEALLRWVRRLHRRAPAGTRSGCTRSTPWTGYELGRRGGHRHAARATPAPGRCGSATPPTGQVQLDVFGPIADLIAAVADARGSVRDEDWRVAGGDGAGGRAPLARARPRHLGGPPAAPAPRLLEGDVLADGRPGAAGAGEHDGEAHRAGLGRAARPDRRERAGARLERLGVGAYTVAYGDDEIDASSLWIGLSGLLADDDPRFLATVLEIEAELRSGPVVYRYRWDDGLPGIEGGFHICTAWLIEAYLRTGRRGPTPRSCSSR